MKITTFLMLIAVMTVSASSVAQKITLNEKQASLEKVLKEIRIQSGYDVIFTYNMLDGAKPVTVNLKDASLEEALKASLAGQGLNFEIEDGTVILKVKEEPGFMDELKAAFAAIDVSGKVVDQNGAPLPGASVVLKSSGKGISTAVDGTFTMRGVEEGEILVIRFIGFDAKEVKAAKDLGTIRMTPATSELDEVQVQAYTQTSKRYSLSNTASVRAKDIENQIVSNPLLALQGRVAGLQIQQMSGNVGSTINVRIQGLSSLVANSTPFFVVDGVPFESNSMVGVGNANVWGAPSVSSTNGVGASLGFVFNGSGSPLSYLNPTDIESIEVLKDADATAIYGSQAANGAIIITTKKGKPGVVRVDVNLTYGINEASFGTKFLNTEQYLEIRREAYRNSNAIIGANDFSLNGTWDQNRYTDWQNELLKTTNYSNGNISVSGGTVNSNYRIGVTANRQRSPYGVNFKNDDIAISTSLNIASANQKFKTAIVANYMNSNNSLPNLNNSQAGSFLPLLPPNAPALYNSDGSLNWEVNQTGTSTFRNPLAGYLTNPFEVKTANITSNLTLSYNVIKGLDFKTSLGYTRMDQQEFSSNLAASVSPTQRVTFVRSGNFRNTNTNSFIIEPQLIFNKQIAYHKVGIIVGATYNQSFGETAGITASGQNTDNQVRNLAAAASFAQSGTDFYQYKYNAIFAKIDYNFKDKYLFSISARRDGSSRFGPENRFANFGSVAAGWIISEEKFIKESASWINFLKLRTNYGITGNDRIGNYTFMDLYESESVDIPYQSVVGLTSRRLTNDGLQWEEKKSLNFGLDAGLFDSRITLGVNYNINKNSNLLQQLLLPNTSGFSGIYVNFDALIQNTGWEYVLGVNLLKSKNLKWNINANVTVPRNKLLSIPNTNLIANVAQYGYVVGQPLGSIGLYEYSGVNPLTGMETIEDINGNPVQTAGSADKMKTRLLNKFSPYYAGLQSTISYKNLSLSLAFDYAKQLLPLYIFASGRPGSAAPIGLGYNQPELTYSLNRWRNPGDIAVIQKYSTLLSNGVLTSSSIQGFEDASYLRLNNVSFSWTVPNEWANAVGMRSGALGMNVQNLYTWTKYSGPNPITGASALPPLKIVVLTLRAGF